MFGDPVVAPPGAPPSAGPEVTMFGDPVEAPAAEQPGIASLIARGALDLLNPIKRAQGYAALLDDMAAGFGGAAESVSNDISGGMQGVNPVAMQEAQPVGVLMDGYVDVDGVREPLEDYPADRFATVMKGGVTYVVPRSAKDSAGQGVEEGRLASAGRLLGYGVPTGIAGAARGVTAPGARQEAAQAAEDIGVTPSFGMQGPARSKVAAAGEQFLPTSGVFKADAARVQGEMGDALGRMADSVGPRSTPEQAGEALQRGGEVYVKGVREFQGRLYDSVNKAIPGDTPIATPDTAAFLRQETGKLSATPNIAGSVGDRQLAGWLSDIEGATKGTPAAKTAAAPKAGKRPTTLLEALQSVGVKDPGGDLDAMGLPQWDRARPGRRNVLRPDGLDQDQAARWLWERGFLDDQPEAAAMRAAEAGQAPEPDLVRAMHRAIDDELGGEPHFAAQDWNAAAAWREAAETGDLPVEAAVVAKEGGAVEGLTFEAARALRTHIGEALRGGNDLERSVGKGRLKAIYGALSRDLDSAVEQMGPEAAYAWNRANKYKAASEERIAATFSKLLGDKVTPEQAYSRLLGMGAADGARADLGTMRRVFTALPSDERATVAASMIRRLGRASAGAQSAEGAEFSASTFLTNWNRMAPEAREIIARNGLDDGVAGQLTKLAAVAERAKAAGLDRNHSNTAGTVATMVLAVLSGSAVGAAKTAAVAGGAYLGARWMTSADGLHALNRAIATGKDDGIRALAKGDGPLAVGASNLLRLLSTEARSSPQSPAIEAPQALGGGAP